MEWRHYYHSAEARWTGSATPATAAISTEQYLAEGKTKVGIEYGVDDRIQQAVEVAQPDYDAD